ncbi:MAG: response regulator transcription factor [Chitinophagaceae bacterium]|nr:MAG: response regulator transcription factor [Chitinophagaceae bacterium]
MKILILDRNANSAKRTEQLICEYDRDVNEIHRMDSISLTSRWLMQNPAPDLIFSDIMLPDGYSFDLFRSLDYRGPVVFTADHEKDAFRAFEQFTIDCILKPVSENTLVRALQKFRWITGKQMQDNIAGDQAAGHSFKNRFLGRIGQRLQFVEGENVSFFHARNKLVSLTDTRGVRYLVDYTLEKLEEVLDPRLFFRLNRSCIVRYSAMEYIRPYLNNRLEIKVTGAPEDDEFIISRERVAVFKAWAES